MKIKKIVSALTVASILGTSVVTPFNVLANPAEAAVDSRVSPTYVAPVTTNIFMSNINTYFPSATLINGILTIDLTKMHVNYGAGVTLPSGRVINVLSKTKDGVSDFMVVDLRNENLSYGTGKIHVEKIDPNNKKWGSYGFDINTSSYYFYSTEFGQAIYNLYDNANFTKLTPGITQQDIIDALVKGATVDSSPEKERLNQLGATAWNMFEAQEAAKTTAARDEVNGLFINNNPASNAIKDTTNQAAIDKAQTLVDAVTDEVEKAKIQADLDKAKDLLASTIANEEAAASKAVKELFLNNNPASNAIKDTTTQKTIDDAQKLVDALTNPTLKATLQKDIDKAQSLLDARNAEEAADKDQQTIAAYLVNQLFVGNTPSSDAIKDTTTQAKINDAQEQINLVKNPTVKAKLQKDLDRAQELLNARDAAEAAKEEQARLDAAMKAVKELYTNNDPKTDAIKETTNQKAIDDAQKLVDKVTDPTVKAALQKDLDRAQELLDAKTAAAQAEKDRQEAAEKAVNELFKGNDPASDAIKAATSQKEIDDAQKLVDKVTDAAKKAELQANLDKAQELLDASLATSGTIAPNEFAVGSDKYITGTYSGDVAKISMFQNGTEFKGAAMKDGEFSFYATDKKIKKTDEIIMVAYDKNGKEVARKLVKFVVVTEGKLTPVEMTIPGHNNVTGTYTGDISKIELTVNGKTYKGGTVANGTFKFYSLDKVTSETDVVVVKGYDSTGKLLDTKTVKIKSTAPTVGTITPAVMTVPGDKNVVGTYTGAVKSLVLTVDGVEYKGGTIANGEFKFYSFDKIKSATSEVTLKAFDKTGKLLDTQVITFK